MCALDRVPTLILISGGGTNMVSLVEKTKDFLDIRGVYSDRESGGIEKAKSLQIPAKALGKTIFEDLKKIMAEETIELILLAGFLKILPQDFIASAPPILNIHPSLLPKYGGKGCYGERVHEMVFQSKDRVSGATVHRVVAGIDTGPKIMQVRVDVSGESSAEAIGEKILPYEHALYAMAVRSFLGR
ncbi:MAG: formyltransferase family protein [Tissierellia bacterium]|nr:formyltransferase family protein [Tissierellia bacterium]